MKNRSKLARKFDRQARIYDNQRKNKKMREWRSKLLKDANGKVLELAVGAGNNFSYYPLDVQVTAVDISPKMIEYAEVAAKHTHIEAAFLLEDIETLHFPENSFDTIVSTLSFCGYTNPLDLLNRLQFWCKPGGKILLMEHGISTNSVLAAAQRLINPLNHTFIGCHLKRDMMGIMAAANLQIDRQEHYFQGMFHLIWASSPLNSKL